MLFDFCTIIFGIFMNVNFLFTLRSLCHILTPPFGHANGNISVYRYYYKFCIMPWVVLKNAIFFNNAKYVP